MKSNFITTLLCGISGTLSFVLILSSILILSRSASAREDVTVELDEKLYNLLLTSSETSSIDNSSIENDNTIVNDYMELAEEDTPLLYGVDMPDTGTDKNADLNYHIVWGDTLNSISERFHFTVDELASYNRISNPDLIYADTELLLPYSVSAYNK